MEYLDIVNENNEITGRVEDRKTAHEQSLWHRHVSSWIMNQKGEILLQRRSPNKERNANKWAKTGGHVDAGEDIERAIFREVKEEIGIEIPKEQIKPITIRKSKDPINKFFTYEFIFIVDYDIDEYTLQKEEVAEVKYVTIEDIENEVGQKNPNYTFSNWDNKSFKENMELLKTKRQEVLKENEIVK